MALEPEKKRNLPLALGGTGVGVGLGSIVGAALLNLNVAVAAVATPILGFFGYQGGKALQRQKDFRGAGSHYLDVLDAPHRAADKSLDAQHRSNKLERAEHRRHERMLLEGAAAGLAGIALVEYQTGKRDLDLQKERDAAAIQLAKTRAMIDAGIIPGGVGAALEPKKTGLSRFLPSFGKKKAIVVPTGESTDALSQMEAPKVAEVVPAAMMAAPIPVAMTSHTTTTQPAPAAADETAAQTASAPTIQTTTTTHASPVQTQNASPIQSQMPGHIHITINNGSPEQTQQAQAAQVAKEIETYLQKRTPGVNEQPPALAEQAHLEVLMNRALELLGDKEEKAPAKGSDGASQLRPTGMEKPGDMTFGKADISQINDQAILMTLTQLKVMLEAKARPTADKAPALN